MNDGSLALDFVSPLPPVRSGISDYSADLLPALVARADVRLVVPAGTEVRDDVAALAPVVTPERVGEEGRLPLYQMGNNHHHEPVFALARQWPGVLTLHDLVLHHFLVGRTAAGRDFDAYTEALAHDHGWIGEAASRPIRWPGGWGDAAKFSLPAHRWLLGRQRGILSHSRWAVDVLHEEIPELRTRTIPMGIPLPPFSERHARAIGEAFRGEYGIPAEVPLLGSFGFQTPIKRTRAVLRALAAPELKTVHLLVGGEVSPTFDLAKIASDLGVADRVHFLGFLPFDAFEAAIAAVDLCLNLRYPTAGETSASLLRILAVGKPVVVSDYAQSADLPDACVVKIPVGEGELPALVARLPELLSDADRLRTMSHAARTEIAERHRVEDAADAVVAACRAWRDAAPLEPPPARPHAPTSYMLNRLPGTLRVEGVKGWRPGTRRAITIELTNDSPGVWLAGEHSVGGVAFEVRLESEGRDWHSGCPWPHLAADLAPGERARITLELRRPLGATRLRIEPHVYGRRGVSELGGPVWEQAV